MKNLALFMCLVVSACASAPSRVEYKVGGVMSGPYRLTADFRRGMLEEAKPPPGINGEFSRIYAKDLAVTNTRSLDPETSRQVGYLADRVFKDGMYSEKACPDRMRAIYQVDWIEMLDITKAGATRHLNASPSCQTTDAKALIHTLSCSMNPTTSRCEKSPKPPNIE